jgi:hypothetical protein
VNALDQQVTAGQYVFLSARFDNRGVVADPDLDASSSSRPPFDHRDDLGFFSHCDSLQEVKPAES